MIKVVIGAGYGDEGKGRAVSTLAKQHPNSLVVRFNGGSQAGHTVETKTFRHVFSHFGAGSLHGASTFLSRHFVSSPIIFAKEYEDIEAYKPVVYVSYQSPVTTFFDVVVNVLKERSRGNNRHGSVGVGFGETIERNLDPEFSLNTGELAKMTKAQIFNFIRGIRETWFPKRLDQLKITLPEDHKDEILGSKVLDNFVDDCQFFNFMTELRDDDEMLTNHNSLIFEGAQGLMLDQDYGAFPHVTRSNTGLKNVADLLKNDEREIIVHYVTRAYSTRHGAGPFPFEESEPVYGVIDKTNKTNPHQGSLRFSYLNLDDLEDAIAYDINNHSNDKMQYVGLMSCVDQLEGRVVYCITNGMKKMTCIDDMKDHFNQIIDGEVFLLRGPKV